MRQPKWLSSALVTAIHDEAVYEFGGLAGIHDAGLLESAIDRPRNRLAYEPRSSLFDLAAVLCVSRSRKARASPSEGAASGSSAFRSIASRA
jgi:prophage maintenance system killer protein